MTRAAFHKADHHGSMERERRERDVNVGSYSLHSSVVLKGMIMTEIMMTVLLGVFEFLLLMCAEEDVIVIAAGEEDAMFGPDPFAPTFKCSRNIRRNIRLLQMADQIFF